MIVDLTTPAQVTTKDLWVIISKDFLAIMISCLVTTEKKGVMKIMMKGESKATQVLSWIHTGYTATTWSGT